MRDDFNKRYVKKMIIFQICIFRRCPSVFFPWFMSFILPVIFLTLISVAHVPFCSYQRLERVLIRFRFPLEITAIAMHECVVKEAGAIRRKKKVNYICLYAYVYFFPTRGISSSCLYFRTEE
jgi:hypothetical protein